MPISVYLLIPILGVASWMDWRERRIPNALLLPSLILAFALNYLILGFPGLLYSFSGALAGFLLLLIPFLLGGIGGGDVKLLMVIGGFGGLYFVLYSFIAGAIIGGIIALFLYIYSITTKNNVSSFPYGIPLSLGAFAFLLFEYWRY